MIGLTLSILLQGTGMPAVEDRLMLCGLRTATLSDPSQPSRLVPEGESRLLAFRLKGPASGRIEGSEVEVHDPTAILEGRGILYVVQNEGTTGFITRGHTKKEGISLVVGPPKPGRVSGDAYLNRLRGGRPVGFAVGGCGFIPTSDAAADFAKVKALRGAGS